MAYAGRDTTKAYQGVAVAVSTYFTSDEAEMKVEDIK